MAKFVVRSHIRHHPFATEQDKQEVHDAIQKDKENMLTDNAENLTSAEQYEEMADIEPIPQEVLRKYIVYARERIHPRLAKMDKEKISRLYSELRRESMITGSIPITIRHIESIIRCAEAHARMHLRDSVGDSDVNVAIQTCLESFIESQKYSVQKSMAKVRETIETIQCSTILKPFFFLRRNSPDTSPVPTRKCCSPY